jgi:excisionase family DNA binding protein
VKDGIIDAAQLLTSSEVGDLLQVNASSVKNWVDEGRLTAFRTPGGHRRIRASDLVCFLETHGMPIPRSLESVSRRRLLVVDDDTAHLRVVARLFRKHEARIQLELASNAIDALVMVGSFRPHLVVLDVFMPEVDGIEVCRRLKAHPETRQVGVVIMSGQLTAEVQNKARHAGARSCMRKPLDVDVILGQLGLSNQPGSRGAT